LNCGEVRLFGWQRRRNVCAHMSIEAFLMHVPLSSASQNTVACFSPQGERGVVASITAY
jgi:hypothetical protein